MLRCPRCGRNLPAQCLYCPVCGTRQLASLPPGTVLGERYQVLKPLSGGGQQLLTLLVKDAKSQSTMVLKELRPDLRHRPEDKQAYQRDLELAGRLAVAGLPACRGVFGHEGRQYLVLAHHPGTTLRAILDQHGRIPLSAAQQILKAGLEILAVMHGQFPPVLHLDLRPENLLLNGWDKLVLLDGAYLKRLGNPHAHEPEVLAYLPPEALRGQTLPATDLYMLGLSVLEAVSGTPASSLFSPISNRMAWDALPDAAMQAVLRRMTESALSQRFASAEEALAAWQAPRTLPVEGPPVAETVPLPAPEPARSSGPALPEPPAAPRPHARPEKIIAVGPPAAEAAPPPPPAPKVVQNVDEVSIEDGLAALAALYHAQNA